MSRIYVDEILPATGSSLSIGGSAYYNNFVGEIKQFRFRRETSKTFPFWNLALPDQNIVALNYPDYADYLRNIKVETCNPIQFTQTVTMSGSPALTATFNTTLSNTLTIGTLLYFHSSGQFRIIVGVNSNTVYILDEAISGSSLVVSLVDQSTYSSIFAGSWTAATQFTLADNVQNRILLDALTEDAYYSGAGFTVGTGFITPNSNWLTLRWGDSDANITSFNPTSRVINIASGSPSGTTIELYPHRIVDSINARHRQVDDSVLINNGIQVVNGLRLRDRGQGHWHSPVQGDTHPHDSGVGGGILITRDSPSAGNYNIQNGIAKTIVSDTINGTPRTGQFTRPRGLGVYFYEYCGRVI